MKRTQFKYAALKREKKTFLAPTGAQGVRSFGLVVKLRSRSSSGEGQVKVR